MSPMSPEMMMYQRSSEDTADGAKMVDYVYSTEASSRTYVVRWVVLCRYVMG
jgi:hypothetical protein